MRMLLVLQVFWSKTKVGDKFRIRRDDGTIHPEGNMNVRPKVHDNPSSSSNSRICYSFNMHFSGSMSPLCLTHSAAGFAASFLSWM